MMFASRRLTVGSSSTLLWRALVVGGKGRCPPRPAARIASASKRWHMTHGGGADAAATPTTAGPRESVSLGLPAAKHTGNILRLLESSHGDYYNTIDTLSTVWHPKGLLWYYSDTNNRWHALPIDEWIQQTDASKQQPKRKMASPQILSLSMSDDRTALVKVLGTDGLFRYLSLLRLDPSPDRHGYTMSGGMVPHDGWVILRELLVSNNNHNTSNASSLLLQATLERYLAIEHGGGEEDFQTAQNQLFAPQASLLAAGMMKDDVDDDDDAASTNSNSSDDDDWSAPVGTLLEIPLDTYLSGIQSQTPHDPASRRHDAIWTIDRVGNAAAATVRVGNGARTLVFEDHLLLGYSDDQKQWNILSKTFSPKVWPPKEERDE